MNWIRLAVGLALLVLPGLSLRWGRGIPPSLWAKTLAASLAGGFLLVLTGLFHESLPALLRAFDLKAVAAVCLRLGGHLFPDLAALEWLWSGAATTLLAGAIMGTVRALRTARRLRAEEALGRHHELVGCCDLVMLPSEEPLAVSVPGKPPQVLVSQGLAARLSNEELEAVIEHESAHLRHHHGRYLLGIAALDRTLGLLPPVGRSLAALRLALERWADASASRDRPDLRAATRRAILRLSGMAAPAGIASFSPADLVVERLRSLETDRRRGSVRSWVAAASLLLVAPAVTYLVTTWGLHLVHLARLAS